MNSETKSYKFLISPSFVSAFLTVCISILYILVYYVKALDSDSLIKEILQSNYQYLAPYYYGFTNYLSNYLLFSNLLLILFWSVVGAFIYVISFHLYGLVTNTVDLEKSLFYVNIDRKSVLETLLIRLALRSIGFFTWLMYCSIYLKVLIPYAQYTVQEQVYTPLTSQILPILQIFILFCLTLHIHAILIRIIALKLRIFDH